MSLSTTKLSSIAFSITLLFGATFVHAQDKSADAPAPKLSRSKTMNSGQQQAAQEMPGTAAASKSSTSPPNAGSMTMMDDKGKGGDKKGMAMMDDKGKGGDKKGMSGMVNQGSSTRTAPGNAATNAPGLQR